MRTVIILMLIFSSLFAKDKGIISGKVIDQSSKEVLVGVNVLLVDTKLGAATNEDGIFKIKNVPVGTHAIEVSYIGYNTVKIINIKVVEDSTYYLVVELSESALELGEAIVVEAERPIIEKHVTSSVSLVTTDDKDKSKEGKSHKVEKRKSYSSRSVPKKSGLKAGFADDNKQYNYFINFLEKYKGDIDNYKYDVSERIHLKFLDENGKSVPNANIQIFSGRKLLCEGKSYADGSFFFFPSNFKKKYKKFKLKYSYEQFKNEIKIPRFGKRNVEIKVGIQRNVSPKTPIDILFILDTTGSMGEEISRLIATIDIIHLNLNSLSSKPNVRFGLVLYRDRNDAYNTKVIPLTDSLDYFREQLKMVQANGGGDTPEDLQAALEKTIHEIEWNENGVKLGFIITDAPPHLDYKQEYTYIDAAMDAKKQGIKLFSVGTGGLDLAGEYIMRQISQLTYAKYIFLTYGEKGESEGGKAGSVSHHTGSNFQTDKLEAIIIQIAKEELSHLTDKALEMDEEYFQAVKIEDESKEKTLKKLFSDAISQLKDYSSLKIKDDSPLGVLPVVSKNTEFHLNCEYFTEQLILSLSHNKTFQLTERVDLQKIMKELGLQLSGLTEEKNTPKVGKLIGAEILLTGSLYDKEDNYELFVKLLRVETGEILAVTKIIIDNQLGLIGKIE